MVTTVDHPALLDTRPNCIRVQAVLGFDSHCKRQRPINHFPGVDRLALLQSMRIGNSLQPTKHRSAVFLIWAYHRLIVLQYRATTTNNLRATLTLPFSCVQNIVFGEPDYLLQNPVTNQVTGICEAKSPWNIGPSEIDDVISG